jgi:hypothetical protein
MTAVRELRYVARRKSSGAAVAEDTNVDDVRTRVSTAFYEIEILAPQEVRDSARALRRAAFDYWNGPRRPGETWDKLQVSTRKALDVFVTTARGLSKVAPYSRVAPRKPGM